AQWGTVKDCRPVGRQSASFRRIASSSVIRFSSGSDGVVGPVERQGRRLTVHDRLQVDGPAPDELNVRQGVGRVVQPQVHAVVVVLQEQLPAVAVVAVYYINPRFSEVRQAVKQPLLDLLELARLDHVLPGLLLEGEAEELVLPAELGGEERVDEGNIVVDAANLEDFLPPQAELPVPGALLLLVVALLPLLAELAGVPAVLH